MERVRFFEKLQQKLENSLDTNENLIILGDFNVTMHSIDRNSNSINYKYKCHSAKTLSSLVADLGLEDSWRIANPSEREYTRLDGATGTRTRLDRAYTDKKLGPLTQIRHILNTFSDHYNSILLKRKHLPGKKG